jgi:hypothetical protein
MAADTAAGKNEMGYSTPLDASMVKGQVLNLNSFPKYHACSRNYTNNLLLLFHRIVMQGVLLLQTRYAQPSHVSISC